MDKERDREKKPSFSRVIYIKIPWLLSWTIGEFST